MRFLLLLVGFVFAANAHAHTPYLLPLSFEPVGGDRVTLDASFAEQFFVPEAAFNNGEYAVVGPDGKSTTPDEKVELKTRVVLEHALGEDGTYLFTTGLRYGAVFQTYTLDGERKSSRDPEFVLPEGAEPIDHFQSVTRAGTYVTKGGPTNTVLSPTGNGLEIVPLTHPNNVFAKEDFSFQVLFDGTSMKDFEVSVYQGKGQFSEETDKATFTTDSGGKVIFTPQEQGVYLVFARHRAEAPKGAKAPRYSHTTTISLEAY